METNVGRSGRGPTKLISPLRTLISCGNSSTRVRRMKRPMAVTRGSLMFAQAACPSFSASLVMLRNLSNVNVWQRQHDRQQHHRDNEVESALHDATQPVLSKTSPINQPAHLERLDRNTPVYTLEKSR